MCYVKMCVRAPAYRTIECDQMNEECILHMLASYHIMDSELVNRMFIVVIHNNLGVYAYRYRYISEQGEKRETKTM